MKKSKRRGYFSPPQVINMQFLLTISVYIHWQSSLYSLTKTFLNGECYLEMTITLFNYSTKKCLDPKRENYQPELWFKLGKGQRDNHGTLVTNTWFDSKPSRGVQAEEGEEKERGQHYSHITKMVAFSSPAQLWFILLGLMSTVYMVHGYLSQLDSLFDSLFENCPKNLFKFYFFFIVFHI